MRYLDTGSRDPQHALGAWLAELVVGREITSLRWQSGFFSVDALGHLVDSLDRLNSGDDVVHVLVGSNDGVTQRRDLELLLKLAGPPRSNLRVGLVVFENAYFHPKTIHVTRANGTEAAYVGSANLTGSGVASLHVEAGMVLDTEEGDDPEVLHEIGAAVDWWFDHSPDGFKSLTTAADLDDLEARGLIGVPRPVPTKRPSTRPTASAGHTRLAPLVAIPPLPASAERPSHSDTGPIESGEPATMVWKKALSRSDAQRKPTGNQRGGITLVAAGYPINAQTYFRFEFFGSLAWQTETTRTGLERERTDVRFACTMFGEDVGYLDVPVTYAPNREASQANYTTILHLGPLAPYFAAQDLTGHELQLERTAGGSYRLTIS